MPLARRPLACLLSVALAVAGLSLASTPALADVTNVSGIAIDTADGDGLGVFATTSFHSPSYVVAPSTSGSGYRFTAQSAADGSVGGPQVYLTPPTGTAFAAGQTYALASSPDATHAQAFVSNATCPLEGSLTVDTVTTDPVDSHLTGFAAGFSLRCVGASSYLYGDVRYQAGDYVAAGVVGLGSVNGGFGTVAVGQTSAKKTVRISATGTAPLVLGTVSLGGDNPGDFSISDDTCSGASVAAGSSCTLSISVTPTARGQRSATLTVPDNTPRGSHSGLVTAHAIAPPAAPSRAHAETATNGVWVAWTAPADNGGSAVTGYQVWRGTTVDDLAQVGTTTGTSFADALSATTTAATPYVYVVKAVNAAGTGSASDPATASTPVVLVTPPSTKVMSVDIEAGSAPFLSTGTTVHDGDAGLGVISRGYGSGVEVTTDSAQSPQSIRLLAPTVSYLAAGTYPLVDGGDATHAAVELLTPANGGCDFTTGSLVLTAFQRDASGTPQVVDADVSGTCRNGSVASASARVGVTRDFPGLSLPVTDAGPAAVGQVSPVPVTYTNSGTTSRHVSSVTVTAPDGSVAVDWALGTPDTCTGTDVAAGASCTATLTVTPSTTGARPAAVTFTDDAAVTSHRRDLTAFGTDLPDAPAGLSSTRASGQVTLTWFDNADPTHRATGFEVLRGTSAADATVRATVSNTNGTISYTDPDTTDGTRYYAVRGLNVAGTGPSSATTLDLALRAPTGLQGSVTTLSSLLTWTAPAGLPHDPITGYTVFRGGSTSTMTHLSSPGGTASYFPPVPAGQHVYLKVAAVTASGTGPFSGVLDVVGGTSQLVVVGPDSNNQPAIMVRPLTPSALSTTTHHNTQGFDEVAVSPNGKLMAFSAPASNGADQNDIYVTSVDGRTADTAIATTAADEWSPAWSPDGKWIAFTVSSDSGDTVCKVPATGGARTCVNSNTVEGPSWLDSSHVVFTFEAGDGPLATGSFGSSTITFLNGTANAIEASVSPDGSRIAYAVLNPDFTFSLRVYSRATKTSSAVAVPSGAFITTPSWSRDGTSLYYGAVDASTARAYRSAANGSGPAVAVTDFASVVFGVSVSTPDTTAPVVKLSGVPVATVAGSVKPLFTATDALNGVSSYTLSYRKAAYNTGFSAPTSLTLTAPTAVAVSPGYTYCFSVRATDRAGNTSAATPEQCTTKPMDDRALARSSGFSAITGSGYYAGTATRSTTKGASLTRTGVTTATQLFVLATTCSSCGTVDVLFGTTRIASVSLASSTTTNLHLVALPAFSARNGTVTIKVTSSGKQVIIDGLGIRT